MREKRIGWVFGKDRFANQSVTFIDRTRLVLAPLSTPRRPGSHLKIPGRHRRSALTHHLQNPTRNRVRVVQFHRARPTSNPDGSPARPQPKTGLRSVTVHVSLSRRAYRGSIHASHVDLHGTGLRTGPLATGACRRTDSGPPRHPNRITEPSIVPSAICKPRAPPGLPRAKPSRATARWLIPYPFSTQSGPTRSFAITGSSNGRLPLSPDARNVGPVRNRQRSCRLLAVRSRRDSPLLPRRLP